jgi:hypothetical protein
MHGRRQEIEEKDDSSRSWHLFEDNRNESVVIEIVVYLLVLV